MRIIRPTLIALALSLPTLAVAAIPVADRSAYADSYAGTAQGMSGTATGGGAQAPLSAQGQLFVQLQQMQEEISTLRGMLEEQQHELRQLRQESLERYQTLDSRVNDSSRGQASSQSATSGQQASSSNNDKPRSAAQQSVAEESDPEKEKLYYDASFDLIKQRDFDNAQKAFTAFLRKYPNSHYAGNAQYWLGEVHLLQGDMQAAGKAFAKVSENYPQHNKVPDSLYKLADVERRLGRTDRARGIFQQVVEQYPNSSAAQLAKQDLGKL